MKSNVVSPSQWFLKITSNQDAALGTEAETAEAELESMRDFYCWIYAELFVLSK